MKPFPSESSQKELKNDSNSYDIAKDDLILVSGMILDLVCSIWGLDQGLDLPRVALRPSFPGIPSGNGNSREFPGIPTRDFPFPGNSATIVTARQMSNDCYEDISRSKKG